MRYYPLIGAILGGTIAGVHWLLSQRLAPMAATTVVVVVLIVLTGALHMDGLADMCDGFYKGRNKSEVLAIMKDSHSGAMALVGVFCVLALKLAFLWSLPQTVLPKALTLMPVAGRWSMVLLASLSPYARPEGGTAKGYVDYAGRKEVVIAALLTAFLAGLIFKGIGLVGLAGTTLFVFLFWRYVMAKIQGVTGDVLGAGGEISECIYLLSVGLAVGRA